MNQKISEIKEGITFVLMPPPTLGLGNGAGYGLFVEDRAGLGFGTLQHAVSALQGAVMQTPGMGYPISGYQANVPQLDAEVDRVKTKTQGITLTDLFATMQLCLGSAYVNDFNLFGRTWRVYAQADGDFRGKVEDIANLKTRNDRSEMVPIGSMVKFSQTYGPDPDQAMDNIHDIAEKVQPYALPCNLRHFAVVLPSDAPTVRRALPQLRL